jgi:integrase
MAGTRRPRRTGHKRFKDGAWKLTVSAGTDPVTGKRKQVHATVQAPNNGEGAKQADIELAKLVVEVASGRRAPSIIRTGEFLERWVEHRRRAWEERSPGQPDWTLNVIRKHIAPYIGDIPVTNDDLRPIDLDDMYDQWRDAGMAEASVRRYHNIVRSALEQAVRWDMLTSNPAARLEPPRPGKRRRKAPADDVLRALLDAADADYACYLRLAAVTGARRGQLVALRWPDLDLISDGTVRFTRAHARVRGGVAEKTTKADVDYGIALDPQTVTELRAHRVRCVERALSAGVSLRTDAFVFAQPEAPNGSKAWTPSAASSKFKRLRGKVARRTPSAAHVQARDLRHWLATSMFADNYDPVTVAGRGGWSSPSVPMSVYAHFSPPRDQAAAASLASRLDGAQDGDGPDEAPPPAVDGDHTP